MSQLAWHLLFPTVLLLTVELAQARSIGLPPSVGVATLETRLASQPQDVNSAQVLAGALLDRIRFDSDPQTLIRANSLIVQVRKAAPNHPQGHILEARALMVVHRFHDALAATATAEALGASDVVTLSTKADALTELGRYEEAEAVIQRLLDQHFGAAALSRAAHFRFLYGDLDGAVELAQRALGLGGLRPFDQAWLTLQLAEFLLHAGDFDGARLATVTAEPAAPIAALALRARVSAAQGQRQEAATLLRAAMQRELRPELAVELWRLAVQGGDLAEAARQRRLLEGIARLDEAFGAMNRRIFASWYAEQDGRLHDAERLARAELAVRPDIYSHDLLAWVLHRQGRNQDARPYAEHAIALGTPDAQLRAHATAIFNALGKP